MRLLIVLLICCGWCYAQDVPLLRYFLNDVSPLALCNDGSPAAYYFRQGHGNGTNRWIIRLQGGGWCYDQASCEARQKNSLYWTTSNVCPASLLDNETISGVGHEGILSSDPVQNPHFYDANHVWMWYCSSDSHIGNRTAAESINGWNFLGKNIIKALVNHLLYTQNPSMLSATEILLTGDSAGGVATFNNVDFIGQLIAPTLPKVHYRAFVDCGWFLDIPAFGNDQFSFQGVARDLFSNWNVMYDESCLENYGTGNEWKCFHAQYAWPFIETLTFWQEFQFDAANLGFDGVNPTFNSSMEQWSSAFQQDMLTYTQKVPYMFLPNCYKHETIDGPMFSTVKIGNVSIGDAVWAWYSDPSATPAQSHTVDACLPINCNPTCPPMAIPSSR